ncbi:thioredoxin [Entomoplasma freundtii]|uniref:Thioredoxin n=1 Tax=Entomoplasma freundtii TaxID=74700 RepID=A0A2K8NTU8_9MOLU|nr:thioredoxin [Entomoplasma freundtii]ATZ16181.1 thioredoxin [Entomoplasma freundtii]TDY56918.1 thioredoxin [Entomoplasma freundtii]
MSKVNLITSEAALKELIANNKKVLIDFKADWCGPCKMFHPILEDFATKSSGITIAQIDVDKNPELASKYNVMSIPSLRLLENGHLVKESSGFMPLAQLEDWVK